ncbi:MAG TPA: hypothetical protein VFA83_18520 [Acidimicrobiales bacterium]|nr:hypothetical protein [Acidimicrobiales bacterium]
MSLAAAFVAPLVGELIRMHEVAHGGAVVILLIQAVVLLLALVLFVVVAPSVVIRTGRAEMLLGAGPGAGGVMWRLSRLVDQLLTAADAPVGPASRGPTTGIDSQPLRPRYRPFRRWSGR